MNSPPLVFDELVIRFTRQIYYEDASAFQLEVRQSPHPLPGGAFHVEVEAHIRRFQELFRDQLADQQFFARFQTPGIPGTSTEALAGIGQELYAVLPPAFRDAFPRLVQRVLAQGHGLRLILETQAGGKADQLLGLPWELLFFAETEAFLSRSPRVLIVRRLLGAIRRSPLELTPPYNVLHVIAQADTDPPRYQLDAGLRQIERETLGQALRPEHYRRVESPGSLEQLHAALEAEKYHVVHFLGHGELHATRGYLRFISAEGAAQQVSGERFQYLLEFSPTVQLVVLNACHGGANLARSVARDLVYNGLPYVVAIQSDILQESARHFIRDFYGELQRSGDIAYAVAVGRAAIAARVPHVADWCLPVLYTNVGLAEPAPGIRAAERLWHWASLPQARQWIGVGNALLGGLHLTTGLLLLLSGQTVNLPRTGVLRWLAAAAAGLPLITAADFYRRVPPDIPATWPRAAQRGLAVRALAAAAMGASLPLLYTWIIWLLLVAGGLWGLLTRPASYLLLGLLFVPGWLASCLVSQSQIHGHVRAYISNASVQLPAFEWGELAVIFGGYLILLLPWLGLTFLTGALALPGGNLWLGVLLGILGYALLTGD